jgi:hypothetical protein
MGWMQVFGFKAFGRLKLGGRNSGGRSETLLCVVSYTRREQCSLSLDKLFSKKALIVLLYRVFNGFFKKVSGKVSRSINLCDKRDSNILNLMSK